MEVQDRRRNTLRLANYDYSQEGVYFLTIVTRERSPLFQDAALMDCAHQTWEELPIRFPNITLDTFVIMPNHLHGIVAIVGAIHELPLQPPPPNTSLNSRAQRRQMQLPKIVGYFKMNSSKRINRLRYTVGTPVWQRNYYEHVIRNEAELARVREYIQNNPAQWEMDTENPANLQTRRRAASFSRHDLQGRRCRSRFGWR